MSVWLSLVIPDGISSNFPLSLSLLDDDDSEIIMIIFRIHWEDFLQPKRRSSAFHMPSFSVRVRHGIDSIREMRRGRRCILGQQHGLMMLHDDAGGMMFSGGFLNGCVCLCVGVCFAT